MGDTRLRRINRLLCAGWERTGRYTWGRGRGSYYSEMLVAEAPRTRLVAQELGSKGKGEDNAKS